MKRKIINKAVLSLLAALTITTTAVPLTVQAYEVEKPEPGVTVRSYDMDEYLDKLLATGHYDKYERFAQVADAESWAKHIANQNNLAEDAVHAWNGRELLEAVMAEADRYGFDAGRDTFTLLRMDDVRAMILVRHGQERYMIKLVSDYHGTWIIKSISEMG